MQAKRSDLYQTFSEALGIPLEEVGETLAYNAHPRWDSTAHLQLVMALEARFECAFDMDDMLDMSSVAKAAKILEKLGVTWA